MNNLPSLLTALTFVIIATAILMVPLTLFIKSFYSDHTQKKSLEILALREQVHRCETEAKLYRALVDLCGHIEDGSDVVVKIFQDDATREWFVNVGGKGGFYDPSLADAIELATNAKKKS